MNESEKKVVEFMKRVSHSTEDAQLKEAADWFIENAMKGTGTALEQDRLYLRALEEE